MPSKMRKLKSLYMPFKWRHNRWKGQLVAAVAFVGWACATSHPGTVSADGGQTVTRVTSPGVDVQITSDRRVSTASFDASMDEVWTALVTAYEQLEIPVTATDHAGWRIGNPRAQTRLIGDERMSRFFECGQASMGRPRADQYAVTYSIFSRLQQAADGQTVLLTEADGSARPRSVSTNPVHCSSKGSLEARIADLVMALLDRGHDPLQ
jgi:hypothetical protein